MPWDHISEEGQRHLAVIRQMTRLRRGTDAFAKGSRQVLYAEVFIFQDFSKAIELNPKYYYAYNNRGLSHNGLKQYKLAIPDFDKAIELNPNYANAYNNRGWAYYCMKNYQQALKDFEKALELNQNHTKAKNHRESCLKALGK